MLRWFGFVCFILLFGTMFGCTPQVKTQAQVQEGPSLDDLDDFVMAPPTCVQKQMDRKKATFLWERCLGPNKDRYEGETWAINQ